MDAIIDYKQEEMAQLESTQSELSQRIGKMQEVIDHIEKDIYAEEGFEEIAEVVWKRCGYCGVLGRK